MGVLFFFSTTSETGGPSRSDEGDLKASESFWRPSAHLTTKLCNNVHSLFFKNPSAVTVWLSTALQWQRHLGV